GSGLSLAKGAARHCCDRLDGGAALSAAAVRLSRRFADRVGEGSDLRNHGAAAFARNPIAGGRNDLWIWDSAGDDPGRGRLAARLDMGEARTGPVADAVSWIAGTLAAGFHGAALFAFGAILSNRQRAADPGDDRDRDSRGRQTVLKSAQNGRR